MRYMKSKVVIALIAMLAVAASTFASNPALLASSKKNPPDLPSPLCDNLQAPPGAKVALHTYAVGVQRYRWNGAAWVFVEPVATLFADENYHGQVGIHYAGPTWESNSGGRVVAARLEGCSADPAAIPWLLLQAVSNDGPGAFDSVTYIQRVNTVGGLAPTAPGASIGAMAEIPYTAEYYFYRARD
jgi:hypothetical protein